MKVRAVLTLDSGHPRRGKVGAVASGKGHNVVVELSPPSASSCLSCCLSRGSSFLTLSPEEYDHRLFPFPCLLLGLDDLKGLFHPK